MAATASRPWAAKSWKAGSTGSFLLPRLLSRKPLNEPYHLLADIGLGLRRERGSSRLITALLKGLRSREIAEPAVGVAEVERARKRRLIAHLHRDLTEHFDRRRPNQRIVDAREPDRQPDHRTAVIARIGGEIFGPFEALFARRIDELLAQPQMRIGAGRSHGARGGQHAVAQEYVELGKVAATRVRIDAVDGRQIARCAVNI